MSNKDTQKIMDKKLERSEQNRIELPRKLTSEKNVRIDYEFAFIRLVDSLTKDDLTCGQDTPKNLTQLTEDQIFVIKEIAKSCIEEAIFEEEI